MADLPHVDIDLDAQRHPFYPQWDRQWDRPGDRRRFQRPQATGFETPDSDGDTVYLRRTGYPREEIPELVAWLTAVYHATAPKGGCVMATCRHCDQPITLDQRGQWRRADRHPEGCHLNRKDCAACAGFGTVDTEDGDDLEDCNACSGIGTSYGPHEPWPATKAQISTLDGKPCTRHAPDGHCMECRTPEQHAFAMIFPSMWEASDAGDPTALEASLAQSATDAVRRAKDLAALLVDAIDPRWVSALDTAVLALPGGEAS